MQVKIESGPAYALAVVEMEPGESVKAEAGAMVSMDASIHMETSAGIAQKGGWLGTFKRMLGGESLFQNTFIASNRPGAVLLAASLPGDMVAYQLDGTIYLQNKAFVACTPGVTIDTQWGGGKGFFSGAGMFLLKASGKGTLIFNSFGAIEPVEIDERGLSVDTGHIVAFDETLQFNVRKFGSWKSFFFSSEGLICEFSGHGRLWMQSRNTSEFGRLVGKLLPPRKA